MFRTRLYRGADKSLAQPGRKQARNHVRDDRDFNNIDTRPVIKSPPPPRRAPKEIYVILTETLACLLPGRAKDLSTPLFSTLPNHSCASGPPVEHDNMDNQALAPRYL